MDVQYILTAVLYAVIIGFFGIVIHSEMTYISSKMSQVSSGLNQEQPNLWSNTTLEEEHPAVDEEIIHEIVLPPAIEEKSVDIGESKMLRLMNQKNLDFTKANITELRKKCSESSIIWRSAVIDIKTGKKRHLRKAEMVEALKQKLSA